MFDNTGENIFAHISNNYYHLTLSEKKVADYVLSHKTGTQFMSISELAEECSVADATVSRFCRRMKLRGYNDFKLSVAKAVASGAANDNPAVAISSGMNLAGEDDMTELTRNLYSSEVAALTQTMSVVNPDSIREAVDMMMNAGHVYCMGQGGSMILAMETVGLFETISGKFTAVQDSHTQATRAALMNASDAVLFFSYSGSTKEILDLITLVHESGAKVILVTRFLKSPGANEADVVLQCGSNEGPLQVGSIPAKMAQLYIVDILYNEYCRRDPEKTRINQEKVANALVAKHL